MKVGLVAFLLVAACSEALPPPPPQYGGFMTQTQREAACLDMRDHLVDLYADAYLKDHGENLPSPEERRLFRDGWADELAKGGTFDRFEASCFASLKVPQYECAEGAKTTEGVEACMKLGR